MKKNKFIPYNINIGYELKTYKKIGTDYEKTMLSGENEKKYGFFKKRRQIKKESKYKMCNTYSEWEAHITIIIRSDMINFVDFIHWLCEHRNRAKGYLNAIYTIVIPVYIALISIFDFILEGETLLVRTGTIMSMILVIVIVSAKLVRSTMTEINFYEDFIEVVEKHFDVKRNLRNEEF